MVRHNEAAVSPKEYVLKSISVVTTSRADYGYYVPLLKQIEGDDCFSLKLLVSGSHLSKYHGYSFDDIKRDGFNRVGVIPLNLSDDSSLGIAEAMGESIIKFSKEFKENPPDLIVVLGDRYEMHSAALAALPFKIPVIHLYGGELTLGAIDDSLRHSMTKLCHLHFVSTEVYQQRVIQMGEEPWRVKVVGALSLDRLKSFRPSSFNDLNQKFELNFSEPPILVTFHPVTLEYENTEYYIKELLSALDSSHLPIVFTSTNADTHHHFVQKAVDQYLSQNSNAKMVSHFGTEDYFNMMTHARLMVGNSSSGIIEAPSFSLPVVNIGTRQKGRVQAKNVINVGYSREEITVGIERALKPNFRAELRGGRNPYGTGDASRRIIQTIKELSTETKLCHKTFNDLVTYQ